jgi:hypothetical protein
MKMQPTNFKGQSLKVNVERRKVKVQRRNVKDESSKVRVKLQHNKRSKVKVQSLNRKGKVQRLKLKGQRPDKLYQPTLKVEVQTLKLKDQS